MKVGRVLNTITDLDLESVDLQQLSALPLIILSPKLVLKQTGKWIT